MYVLFLCWPALAIPPLHGENKLKLMLMIDVCIRKCFRTNGVSASKPRPRVFAKVYVCGLLVEALISESQQPVGEFSVRSKLVGEPIPTVRGRLAIGAAASCSFVMVTTGLVDIVTARQTIQRILKQ